MLKWIQAYREAGPQTKYFYLTLAVYGLVIVLTTVYAYGKLQMEKRYSPPVLKSEPVKDK